MDIDLLNKFIHAVDSPMLVVDGHFCILSENPAAQMLLQRKQPADPGIKLKDAWQLSPDTAGKMLKSLKSAVRDAGNDSVTLVFAEDELFPEPVRLKISRFQQDSKNVYTLCLDFCNDHTPPPEELLAGSSIVMIEALPDEKIIFGLGRLAKLLHLDRNDILNSRISELVTDNKRLLFMDTWARVLAGEVINGYEFQLQCGSGHDESFWFTLHPVTDTNGNIKCVHGLIGDMRVQKGLAYALEAAEERFSLLFQESSDPILILSLSGDIMLANPAFEELAGIGSEDLFAGNKSWCDFIHGEDISTVMSTIWACSKKHRDHKAEYRVLSGKDTIWVEQTYSIIHNETGAARGILAIARDITLRKQREIQLKEKAELMTKRHGHAQEVLAHLNHFLTVISELPEEKDAFLRGGCDLLFEIYNPLMLDIWLKESDEFVYKAQPGISPDLINTEENKRVSFLFEDQVLHGLPVYCNELASTHPFNDDPGVINTGLMTYLGVPLRDSSGGVHGLLRLLDTESRDFQPIDVEMFTLAGLQVADWLKTDQHKQITADLEAHLRQAQKMEAVGMLAGGIAHDFNNILSSILGFSSFLMTKVEKDSTLYRPLSLIEKSATHAADLTRQLLAFSRKKSQEQIPVSMNNLIRGVVGILEHSLQKNIHVEMKLDKSLPAVMGDQGQLNQIIMNLCLNAADAMDNTEGTLLLKTEFRPLTAREKGVLLDVPGNLICINISDTGKGISEEVVEHIFDPFYTTKQNTGGTGLGLSIVYGLVTKHGGDIRVETQKGEGSVFTIYLPPCKSEEVHAQKKEEQQAGGNETILIIDDEKIILEMVSSVLTESGYKVLLADSGERGVEIVKSHQNKIDLVLLDMLMPGMDGEATFGALREVEPGISILLTSGLARTEHCAKLIQKGAKGMISKPYTSSKLISDLQRVLG